MKNHLWPMSTRNLWLPLLALWAVNATAATATASLGVSATVSATCNVTTTPVSFGAYNPGAGSPNDTGGAVTVTCTSGSTYTIALDAGANPSTAGDPNTRRMLASTSNYLPYSLYLDSGRTTIWGDATHATSVFPSSGSITGDGTAQSHTVYGRIAAGQYVPAGSYSDTVTVTVSY